MEPLAIIEPFDKPKDLSTGLVPRLIRLVMDQFILQRAEEAFRDGVVITVTPPTHTCGDAESDELLLIRDATLLEKK